METPASSARKPDLTKDGLEENGVTYDPNLLEASDKLPWHVQDVREVLLDFDQRIAFEWREKLELDLAEVKYTLASEPSIRQHAQLSPMPETDEFYWKKETLAPDIEDEKRSAELSKPITRSRKAASKFKRHYNQAEAAWTHALIAEIFQRYDSETSSRKGRFQMFQEWCLQENVLWSAQRDTSESTSDFRLKAPKPDLTYAYPLFRLSDNVPRFFSKLDCMTLYSAGFMQDLSRTGLKCTLCNDLLNAKPNTAAFRGLQQHHLMAFPWAVVEVKTKDVPKATEDFCFNQAANATAAAIRIQKRLIDHAGGSSFHIPPIVAFTCIGPKVKVWLTYFDQEKDVTCMVCIWSANLTSAWGVLSIQLIVENMHEWASEQLRVQLNGLLVWIKTSLRLGHGFNTGQRSNASHLPHEGQSPEAESLHGAEQNEVDSGTSRRRSPGIEESSTGLPSTPLRPQFTAAMPGADEALSRSQVNSAASKLQQSAVVSPGHDSVLESDVELSPLQERSARTGQHEQKTSSDANSTSSRHDDPYVEGTSFQHASHLTGPTIQGHINEHLADNQNRVPTISSPVSMAPESGNALARPLWPAEESPTIAESQQSSRDINDTLQTTPTRPSNRRMMSNKAKALRQRGTALANEAIDHLNKKNSVHYPDLTTLLSQEAALQRQSEARSVFDPTGLSGSPVQSPAGEVPDADQDSVHGSRRSTSSRHSFFSRRTSSKLLHHETQQTDMPTKTTDAASEVSVSSSRAGSMIQTARRGIESVVTKVSTTAENFDFKGVAREVLPEAALERAGKMSAWYNAHRSQGDGSLEVSSGDTHDVHFGDGGGYEAVAGEVGREGNGKASDDESRSRAADEQKSASGGMPGAWAA